MYYKKIKIGNQEIENNIFLAPMAGITDKSYRKICKKMGAGLVYTEMISSRAIFHDDTKTKLLMDTNGELRPVAYQIFGSEEESMAFAAKYLEDKADIIDINMGCPAPKVVKNGDGSKLLLDINKAEKVIEAVVKNTTKRLPKSKLVQIIEKEKTSMCQFYVLSVFFRSRNILVYNRKV